MEPRNPIALVADATSDLTEKVGLILTIAMKYIPAASYPAFRDEMYEAFGIKPS